MKKHFFSRFCFLFLSLLMSASQVHALPQRGIAGDLWADIVLGQLDFGQVAIGKPVSTGVDQAGDEGSFDGGSELVDLKFNRLYVYDNGNNRVLVVNLSNLTSGQGASIVLGQPDFHHSACNGDSGFQNYPNPPAASATCLCGKIASSISISEVGSAGNMAVDGNGNLYVPDYYNNRVVRYNKTDIDAYDGVHAVAAAFQWGQKDFTGFLPNGPNGAGINPTNGDFIPGNPANNTIFFDGGANAGLSSAGVAIDSNGNLWVADKGNRRVLRFPNQGGVPASTADLVLGQNDFISSTSASGVGDTSHMTQPMAVRVDNSGDVYVAEVGDSYGRLLVYQPPLSNGMPAAMAVSQYTFSGAAGPVSFGNPSGLEWDLSNPSSGALWVTDPLLKQVVLLPTNFSGGATATKVLFKHAPSNSQNCGDGTVGNDTGASFTDSMGNTWDKGAACMFEGSVGVDASGNVFTGTGNVQDVWRFPAPIPAIGSLPGSTDHGADIQVFKPPVFNLRNTLPLDAMYGGNSGVAVPSGHDSSNNFYRQLIATDGRILFWNIPNGVSSLVSGQPANGAISNGASLPTANPFMRIRQDNGSPQQHLWVMQGGTQLILAFNLPLSASSTSFVQIGPTVPVLGGGNITWTSLGGIAPSLDSAVSFLWVTDPVENRVLRIRNPLGVAPNPTPVVDIILGQLNPTSIGCNQTGLPVGQLGYCAPCNVAPTASSLFMPGSVRLDHHGNLYVSDSALECWGNYRLLRWNASQLPAAQTSCTFAIPATFVYGHNGDFTSTTCSDPTHGSCAPFEPAFTSDDSKMVVGTNPYNNGDPTADTNRFPVVLQNPVSADTEAGNLKDFASMPYAMDFDDQSNLYVADLDRPRVEIYLNPFPAATTTPTPTSTVTPSATTGSGCGSSPANLQLKEYTSLNGNQASENFEIINTGSTSLNLSQIMVKFWIDDTTGSSLGGAVNYGGCYGSTCTAVSGVAISAVNFSPACGPDGSHQANWETTVSTTDGGTLGAGVTWGNIQTAIHLANFANFSGPSLWYSPFSVGGGNTYTNDPHYAVYYQGNLVTASGGIPPSCRAAATCTPSGSTGTPTATPSRTYTATSSPTFTATMLVTSTPTPTVTPTRTNSPGITSTATSTRTFTSSPTISPTPIVTSTPTSTRSATSTFTATLTKTMTPSPTVTLSPTQTFTPGLATLRLQFKAGTTADPTNNPVPQLLLFNDGTAAVDLTKVEIRYWFTEEGSSAQQAVVDWAGRHPSGTSITSFLSPSIQTTIQGGQTNYVRYLFASGVGVLNPGENVEIQSRFNKTDWSNYTQSNDWSYTAFTVYTNWAHVTAYLNNVLVWGQEPGTSSPAPMRAAVVSAGTPASASRVAPSVVAAPNFSKDGEPIQFRVTLPQSVPIQLSLYNLTGEKVAGITAEGKSGETTLTWDLTNGLGEKVASGLYLYVLRAGDLVQTGKVALIR